MTTIRSFRSWSAAVILVLLGGCSTSELIDVWSSTTTQYPPFRSVLVIAAGTDRGQRRIWEDAFCAELTEHYTIAVPSYRYYPEGLPDTAQVIRLVRANEYDGVIVVRTLAPGTDPKVVQGYSTGENTTVYDRHRARFVTYYHGIDHISYVDSQKVNRQSIDVWSIANDGALIWYAESNTPARTTGTRVRSEVARLVMSELSLRGIIASSR